MQIQEVRYFAYACCLECPRTIQTSIKKEKCSSEMCYNLKSICDKTYKHRPWKHTN